MKIKKAILTGGGRATRLRPITTTMNKHLIPLANKPMIFHAIEKAVEAGIEEVFINLNPEEKILPEVVGAGDRWGIKIKYFVQEGGPQGIAHVVNCAQKFIGSDPFMFYLSDNVILGSLKPMVRTFDEEKCNCLLAFARVPDPERFGVPVFDAAGKLIEVWEKPPNPPNNFAVTGIYLYGPDIFFKAFQQISKSARGEYEISDIHSYFLKNNYKVGWREVTGWWKDTGKPEDLILANKLLLDELPDFGYCRETVVPPAADIAGKVGLGKGVVMGEGVKIIGPTLIGDGCHLRNCTIGPRVAIGIGSTVNGVEIRDSIVFDNCTIEAPAKISDSIISAEAKILRN